MRGKCLCGAVEFEIGGNDVNLYQCHCSLCRKQSGTCSNAATIVPSEAFEFLRGEAAISSWVKDTGFRSDFCSRCGSPVPNPVHETNYYWIPAGLLDHSDDLRVVSHVCTSSSVAWAKENPDAQVHLEFPGLEEHIKSLA